MKRWKLKGVIQGGLSRLPGGVALNDLLQRTMGGRKDLADHVRSKIHADWIVNATGVETNIDLRPGELMHALRERGRVLPGRQGIGIASTGPGQVLDAHGRPDPRLRVIGALRIGDLWESIAIPELRMQARQIAEALPPRD